MRPGTHAAADGSFGRSAGMQVGRAVVLLAIAILIGVALLRHNGTSNGRIVASTQTTAAPTTLKPPSTTAATAVHGTTTTTAPLRSPQDIKVLVANGTSTQGLATTLKSKLQGEGYQTLTSTNSLQKVTTTVIYYRPGYDNEAMAMAQFLSLPSSAVQAMPAQLPVPANAADGANIIVVAGPDVAAGGGPGGTTGTSLPGGTTTTTRARTTTTTRPAGH